MIKDHRNAKKETIDMIKAAKNFPKHFESISFSGNWENSSILMSKQQQQKKERLILHKKMEI